MAPRKAPGETPLAIGEIVSIASGGASLTILALYERDGEDFADVGWDNVHAAGAESPIASAPVRVAVLRRVAKGATP